MNMMLVAIFAAVAVGMFAKGFGRRETMLCVGIAAALTAMYLLRPWYMT
jgi:hypothetical protein